jgi:hypothetical protein
VSGADVIGVNHPIDDPYRTCEHGQCTHDLARAVTIEDLLGTDGPFPPRQMIVNLGTARPERPTLFDDMEEPLEAPARRAG